MKKQYVADLFCGAGGTSTGLLYAARELGLNVELIAVNHWDVAIATHSLNHPEVRHVNSDLEKVDPLAVIPGGKLHLLVASPECTHFSKARGGKPMSKQSRASVKYILRWVSVLDVENVLIENVPEFMDWGPLHRKGPSIDKPIKNRKGEYFHRFIRKMQEHGYTVKWRVLNAADYGDPTTRKRLFVMARKGASPVFPEPSHGKVATDMFGTRKTWRPARDIIDWTLKGESVFTRKRPLADNTMRRIMAGLKKFGGKALVLGQQSGAAPRSTDEPFLVPFHSENKTQKPRTHSVNQPLPTVHAGGIGFGLAEPYLVEYYGTGSASSVDEPLKTQTGRDRFGLVQPMIFESNGTKYLLDIRFRMLQPHELARAMSFPKGYKFHGNREQVVKQIGNAVPVELAKSLCKSLLSGRPL